MLEYINKSYKPKESDILCLYRFKPKEGVSMEEAAEHLAAESSIGTWTDIVTMNEEIAHKLKPQIYEIDEENNIVKIAYPIELFEINNMSGILSSICGNILGMKVLESLRVCDIKFPEEVVKQYPGPYNGIEGIRKTTNLFDRPFTGTIIKPKVGLTYEQHAEVGMQAWVGTENLGLDIVKDDENLTSQSFNDFYNRIKLTLANKKKAEDQTGEKKLYLANITHSDFDEMMKRDEYVRKNGGEVCMLDVITLGFGAVHTYRMQNTGQIIHAHRAMHGAITREPGFTISMLVLAKVYRMLGVDLLHVGTAGAGKMEGGVDETMTLVKALELDETPEDMENEALGQSWYGMKPVVSVASGGLHPGKIPLVIEKMGKDIVCQMGGGCHGHPEGTAKGATAVRQAVDATMKGISLEEYAKDHEAIAQAIEKWGAK